MHPTSNDGSDSLSTDPSYDWSDDSVASEVSSSNSDSTWESDLSVDSEIDMDNGYLSIRQQLPKKGPKFSVMRVRNGGVLLTGLSLVSDGNVEGGGPEGPSLLGKDYHISLSGLATHSTMMSDTYAREDFTHLETPPKTILRYTKIHPYRCAYHHISTWKKPEIDKPNMYQERWKHPNAYMTCNGCNRRFCYDCVKKLVNRMKKKGRLRDHHWVKCADIFLNHCSRRELMTVMILPQTVSTCCCYKVSNVLHFLFANVADTNEDYIHLSVTVGHTNRT